MVHDTYIYSTTIQSEILYFPTQLSLVDSFSYIADKIFCFSLFIFNFLY